MRRRKEGRDTTDLPLTEVHCCDDDDEDARAANAVYDAAARITICIETSSDVGCSGSADGSDDSDMRLSGGRRNCCDHTDGDLPDNDEKEDREEEEYEEEDMEGTFLGYVYPTPE